MDNNNRNNTISISPGRTLNNSTLSVNYAEARSHHRNTSLPTI